MSMYQKRKERAREKAIQWQSELNDHNYSYGELAFFQDYFTSLAKRYGLVGELRENGII